MMAGVGEPLLHNENVVRVQAHAQVVACVRELHIGLRDVLLQGIAYELHGIRTAEIEQQICAVASRVAVHVVAEAADHAVVAFATGKDVADVLQQ